MTGSSTSMHAVITAGPTYEPLDQVRRLTNFSTGSLGAQLAGFLKDRGMRATLLTGSYTTYTGPFDADERLIFTTTEDLIAKVRALASQRVDAFFHAAAVSDFAFGDVVQETEDGSRHRLEAGKISTRQGKLMAELVPTPKILPQLRALFQKALLVGWKYEVEGDAADLLEKVRRQLTDCDTDLCVLNGPAIGTGFQIHSQHSQEALFAEDRPALFQSLWEAFQRSRS